MKPSLFRKLELIKERHIELGGLLSSSEVISDQEKFRKLSKEYSDIEPIVEGFDSYLKALNALEATYEMLKDSDLEIRELAQSELDDNKSNVDRLEQELNILLLPKDPNDECNVFLEIRAGTGGDEASIFCGDLFRMYSRFAEDMKWKVEIMSESESEHGGYKEIIMHISGKEVYGKLKFESGAHRVQRVPVTESQGRIHTSACTVAVLPEVSAVEEIELNMGDLRIDTYRASGAGGQHVNKTDSAVRLTHIPTGVVVECQDERSQHKNKAKALSLMQAKLLDMEQSKQKTETAEKRRSLVGSGDRSERIRTYNYPQARVTDHRINLTLYKLPAIMEGDLSEVIEPLVREHQADLLAATEEE